MLKSDYFIFVDGILWACIISGWSTGAAVRGRRLILTPSCLRRAVIKAHTSGGKTRWAELRLHIHQVSVTWYNMILKCMMFLSLQGKKVAPCRFDWHQTGSQVTMSIYAKNSNPELCSVEANSISVSECDCLKWCTVQYIMQQTVVVLPFWCYLLIVCNCVVWWMIFSAAENPSDLWGRKRVWAEYEPVGGEYQ